MSSAEPGDIQHDGRRLPPWLIGLLVVAALLRLSRLDLVSMTNEMAGDGLVANVLVASPPGPDWPLAGRPGEGVRGSALFIYLISLPNQVIWHPLTGVALVALLNIWAVYLAYRLAGRLFGTRAAWATAMLYACSPWAVVYSRQLWAGSCLAVVSLWLIGLSLAWLSDGGHGRLLRMLILGFVMPQLHYSGLAATGWLVAVLVIGRHRLNWSTTGAGVCFGVATWTPWAVEHQRVAGRWDELLSSMAVLGGKADIGRAVLDGVDFLQSMLHSDRFAYWFAAAPSELPGYFPGWQRGLLSASGVLIILGLTAAAAQACSGSGDAAERRVPRLLWLWVALPLLGGLLYQPAVRPDHLLIALPVLLILLGAGVGRMLDTRFRIGRVLLRGAIATIVVSHLLFLASWYRFLDDDRASPQGHYGLSFRQRRDVTPWILSDCQGKSVELAGPFRGGYPAYEFIYYYERSQGRQDRAPTEQGLRYWIDEEPRDERLDEMVHWRAKERVINKTLPNPNPKATSRWRIQDSHRVGVTSVYRIRLLPRSPFNSTSASGKTIPVTEGP